MMAESPDEATLPIFLIAPTGEAPELLEAGLGGKEFRTFRTVGRFLADAASAGSGCILLPTEVSAEEVRTLLAALATRKGPWVPVLVERSSSAEDGDARAGDGDRASDAAGNAGSGAGNAAGNGADNGDEVAGSDQPGGGQPRGGEGGRTSSASLMATPLSLGFREEFDALLARLDRENRETVEHVPLLELRTVLSEVARARHDINNPLTAALAETQLLLMDIEEGEVREAVLVVERQLRRIRDLVARLSSIRPPGGASGRLR